VSIPAAAALQMLENALRHDRVAHAYLVTGPAGCGKRQLTERLCGLLVKSADPLRHPDVHTVEPESRSRRIVIEQMRSLEHDLQMRSSRGGRKVGVIFDADRLQPQASNAFLKTLEEPPPDTHLVLVTEFPDQLLETILSRCIEIPLRATEKPALTGRQQELLEVLRLAATRERLDLPHVFGLVRDFQRLLVAAKEEAQQRGETELKREEQRYKQIADPRWLEEREDYFKALSEAQYVGERSRLLEVLEQWWADVLRQQSGAPHLDFPGLSEATAGLADRFSRVEALRRSGAIEKMRELLGNAGIQEPLAIEVAFLNAFGSCEAAPGARR